MSIQSDYNALADADRRMVSEAAVRLSSERVYRMIMDGLLADALLHLAALDATDVDGIRKWQERYAALKQFDTEVSNLALALPKQPRKVI